MYILKLIKHSEATPEILDRAITLKQKAWPYPKESQLFWIKENLGQEDIHVFLQEDEEDMAYLNLVRIQVQINNKNYEGYGIGNVCARIKGKGYGNKLIRSTNDYLITNNKIGLLFCHAPLIKFYSGCNWELLPSGKCISPQLDASIYVMTYNTPTIITSLYYSGKIF